MPSTWVWNALPTPRGTKTAVSGPIVRVKTVPKLSPGPQIHPGAEDLAGGHRDELVPRLGVDSAGRAGARC